MASYRGRQEEVRSRFEQPKLKYAEKVEETKGRMVEPVRPTRTDQNLHRQRHDNHDEDCTIAKQTDSNEVRDLRLQLKFIMNKLSVSKREKQHLAKENKTLQEEVLTLQSNLRQMIPGFSNTSSSFPMQKELLAKAAEFYKTQCLDLFYDVLYPELSTKGVLKFFEITFTKLQAAINAYMNPAMKALQDVGCFSTLEGPIMNVLRKSFQANYTQISTKIITRQVVTNIIRFIHQKLQFDSTVEKTFEKFGEFVRKLGELIFECSISDPVLHLEIGSIGKKVAFNALRHDPFDGFPKAKQECWVVIPEIRKNNESADILSKSLVLPLDCQ